MPNHPRQNSEIPSTLIAGSRRILIAEDDDRTRGNLKTVLQADPALLVDTATDGGEALKLLTKSDRNYSIFLTDLKMPGLDGLQLIEAIQERKLPVTVIVMTAFGSIEDAVQAMKLGAAEFLTKPIDPDHLGLVIARALRERQLVDEIFELREKLQNQFSFQNIISKSPRMHDVFELVKNVAHTTTTVLVEGATGTGKEMVAKAIHEASGQSRSGPFVPVNCAALPENLLESELFGHEKGAFTGAASARQGRFELAHGGTLFLDEVGEIPPSVQVKLLRILQERSFERVGGTKSINVDVRLIGATNKRLSRLVKQGKFREDLYYRLNVLRVHLPRLRERREDIPLLAAHFAEKYATPGEPAKAFAPETMEALINYRWPGNVRELENAIERACVVCREKTIEPAHLPPELTSPAPSRNKFEIDLSKPLPELLRKMNGSTEKTYIKKALAKTGGNVSQCAKICGLSRRSLTGKIAEYGIDKKAVIKTQTE